MDNSEVITKLENIEILFSASIENMNKIVAEATDPKNRQKEAEILNQAYERQKTLLGEFTGSISRQRMIFDDFKPVVETRQYTIDMKNPLFLVLFCIVFCLGSLLAALVFHEEYKTESELKMKYKQESDNKDDNYMKYKWLELFGTTETRTNLKAFDKDYAQNWKAYDKQTRKREKDLDDADRAKKEAELRTKEAKRLQQHSDSLLNGK